MASQLKCGFDGYEYNTIIGQRIARVVEYGVLPGVTGLIDVPIFRPTCEKWPDIFGPS